MMDPPPLVPSLSTITPQNHLESLESSPGYCHNHVLEETWPADHHVIHEPLPHVPNAKLRLMCSYGGHIMPRPHDKSLSYVGGDTRIVAVDRHSSLKDLIARLSLSLLHGRPFTLKYQLPNEDLDNLITVATDEDLDHMIEEHDRLSSSKLSPSSRLRMFLFFTKPDTTVSMGALSLLDDAKSETWFVDALNNSGINLQRGVSDSAATDQCLVNLDESNDLEAHQVVVEDSNNKEVKQEVQYSVADSPMVVENNSFYGSSSSGSSMANLPPIRVHVDENGGSGTSRIQQDQQRIVMEEQCEEMSFGATGVKHLLDDGYAMSSSAAPNMNGNAIPGTVTMVTSTTDNVMNRVVSDDDRSDHHGAPAGYRKPPLPLQLVQPRTTPSGGFSLASPDSVASDSSIASANSFSKTVYYHEQVQAAHVDNKAPAMPNIKSEIPDQSPILQREQRVQDSGYTLPQQLDQNQHLQHQQQQQQFVYIHHPAATGQVPMSSYYSLYAPPSQQQLHHPIYVMPVGPTQPYSMTLQSNIADPNVVSASARPLIPQSAAASAAYKDGAPPNPTIPEVAPTVYKATVASNPAFVHIPPNQFQQQYVGVPQNIHHQPHPIAMAPSMANYGYEYDGGPIQDQAHYTQQQATTLQPSQYQSMTPAAAAAALPDVSKQFPMDNIKHPIK